MDSAELAFAGAARQAELIRAGQITSREVVEASLARIERLDPQINAFRTVMTERALAEADQADRRHAAGEDRPLLGVPVAIKDNVDVAGELTTDGTAAHGPPATEDAEIVRLLRAAGAVVVGKTNLPELAVMGTTESLSFGVTRNPWDLDRTPGGSSGGSAAAVAAGLVALGQSSDGAGSIRIPASCCGLFGLKPSRGRVSMAPTEGHWFALSTPGVVTRSVADSALFLDVTAHTTDGPGEGSFADAASETPGPLRVAVSTRFPVPSPGLRLAPEVRGALERTAERLRALGHDVRERDPDYGHVPEIFLARYLKGVTIDAENVPRPERLQRRTRGFMRIGDMVPRAAVLRTIDAEAGQTARVLTLFDEVDVLMTPVASRQPVLAAQWEGRSAARTLAEMGRVYPYTGIWNATGQPAASVPVGFDSNGLPLAVQLVGRPRDERTLLSLAAQLEGDSAAADRRPPLATF